MRLCCHQTRPEARPAGGGSQDSKVEISSSLPGTGGGANFEKGDPFCFYEVLPMHNNNHCNLDGFSMQLIYRLRDNIFKSRWIICTPASRVLHCLHVFLEATSSFVYRDHQQKYSYVLTEASPCVCTPKQTEQ